MIRRTDPDRVPVPWDAIIGLSTLLALLVGALLLVVVVVTLIVEALI
jgi:hypothetical protein